MNCPHCNTELDIDFWEYYDNKNPFNCPICGDKIYLHWEEYYDEETGDEDAYGYLSKSEDQ